MKSVEECREAVRLEFANLQKNLDAVLASLKTVSLDERQKAVLQEFIDAWQGSPLVVVDDRKTRELFGRLFYLQDIAERLSGLAPEMDDSEEPHIDSIYSLFWGFWLELGQAFGYPREQYQDDDSEHPLMVMFRETRREGKEKN